MIIVKQIQLLEQLKKEDRLSTIQEYLKQVIAIRGFDHQSVEKEMLLLTEEIGELAKAIRKDKVNMGIDQNKLQNYDSVESEIADVFIVIVSICNKLGISLYECLIEKEMKNIERTWKPVLQK